MNILAPTNPRFFNTAASFIIIIFSTFLSVLESYSKPSLNASSSIVSPRPGFNSQHVQQIITKKHDPTQNKIGKEDAETVTFAVGCFWGVQLAF